MPSKTAEQVELRDVRSTDKVVCEQTDQAERTGVPNVIEKLDTDLIQSLCGVGRFTKPVLAGHNLKVGVPKDILFTIGQAESSLRSPAYPRSWLPQVTQSYAEATRLKGSDLPCPPVAHRGSDMACLFHPPKRKSKTLLESITEGSKNVRHLPRYLSIQRDPEFFSAYHH